MHEHEVVSVTMDWNPDSRVSFGLSSDARDALDEIADREDVSRSEKLRELVRKEIEAKGDLDGPTPVLPDDEQLADAYRMLHERAYAEWKSRPKVKLETAKNKLYTPETPKSAVVEELVKPLERMGYVSVDPGHHTVWVVVRPMRYADSDGSPVEVTV